MSLILEALRKSESERQLGQLPGLMSPVIAVRRRRPYRRWLMLALALLLGLGGGWWLAHRLVTAPEATQSPPTAVPVATTTASAPAADETPTSGASASGSATAAAASLPIVPSAASPRTVELPAQAAPATASPPASATASAATPAVQAPPPTTALPSPALPGTTSPDTAAGPASTIPDSVPLSQMPATQRASLPPLKLSVHVFADDTSRRFAIIDGRRLVEGDALGNDVRVREIQRHGVLLDIGGQPWLLERQR